jgi:hypothetical protein
VRSGTLSFNNGGFANDIVTNAAKILLDGASGTPRFLDQNGFDALRNFANNASGGTFTLQNSLNFTTSSAGFTNAGTVNIGPGVTFNVGGSHDYVQTAGVTSLTDLSSILTVAAGHKFDLQGGVLQGSGSIVGDLSNAGTVHPGLGDAPGFIIVSGNYTQAASGILDIQIGGPAAGTGYSVLVIGGTAMLGGTLDLSLVGGFTPVDGELFSILTSGGLNGTEFSLINGLHEGNVAFTVDYKPGDVILEAHVSGAVPEPSTFMLFGIGLAALGALLRVRERA